jgi:small-conductance mechanosensitive channel
MMEHFSTFKVYLETITHYFSGFWRHNIITVASSDIQVGNIVMAALLSILGFKYLRRFINKLKHYVKSRVHEDHEAADVLEKAVGYVVTFLFVILILEISNVPISSLAFIGGALALGIGLGAQNLINNFISSIIIAIEKPIKIGDTIEVEGIIGRVTSLGTRCIIIVTDANLEVLIPTSNLLQNSFINWSLNNNLVKKSIQIKIASKVRSTNSKLKAWNYEEGKRLLEKIVEENEYVDHSTAPSVYLINVIDNTFIYEISYGYDLAREISIKQIQHSLSFELMQELGNFNVRFSISHFKEGKKTYPAYEVESGNFVEEME